MSVQPYQTLSPIRPTNTRMDCMAIMHDVVMHDGHGGDGTGNRRTI